MLNQIILVGRLVDTPEIITTNSGKNMTYITLAIPRSFKNADGEYEVELTHECNWHCPYCAIDVHNLPVLTHIDIVAKLSKIPSKSVVTLSGGEPGLISRDELDYVIMHLREKNCKLNLNTNGTFIAKYPSLLN